MKGIALHSIVPVRAEAREGAEQETQMLFGELCEIVESHQLSEVSHQPQWYRVRLEADGAEGWVDAKMISPIGGKDYTAYKKALKSAAYVSMPMAYAVSENNGQTIPLTAGTRLTNYQFISLPTGEGRGGAARFEVLGVGFRIDPGMVMEQPLELNEQNLMQVVRFFLNVPYLWGGKNAMGMDCSGFTQVVMSLFGKQLPRNAGQQVKCGREISGLKKAKAGDLVFFDHHDGKISHVGIILQPSAITATGPPSEVSVVHCSGRVKVEKMDETGIFSVERADKAHPQGVYSHQLSAIRRLM
mgnify:CR=1 FL=1